MISILFSVVFIFNHEKHLYITIILFIVLLTNLTFVEVRPTSKLEQNLVRQWRQNRANLVPCQRTKNDNGGYIEYCLEKILSPNGHSYSTETSAILYKTDGTIIPLHQAESDMEIKTLHNQ